MGTVLKVFNPAMNRPEAVKVLSAARPNATAAVKHFLREIRLGAPWNTPESSAPTTRDSTGTPPTSRWNWSPARRAQRVAEWGPRLVSKAVEYLRQASAALRYAWEGYGLVHRDVKPSNLMVTGEGRIKLLDFDIGRLAAGWGDECTLTETGDLLGSLDYIATEQISDARAVDNRADIYSLGCTSYHLLCGRAPYYNVPRKHKLLSHQSAEAGPCEPSGRPCPP